MSLKRVLGVKNFLPIRCKKFTFLSSPLALLVLGACGGGGGGISTWPSGGSSGGSSSSTVGGNVVKGPLSNALVGLDYDGDGVVDSSTVRTGADGSYSLTTTNSTYTVIAVADETTIDTSSGTVLSGITLKAPAGASVVTPTTTLIEEAGITKEQVAEVLGLPDGVDPLSFNPYADGVDAADALAVEKASQQIMSVVNAFAGAAEGSGATEAEAFAAALNSVVEVVKTKATNLSDANASAADRTLDLTSSADLALVKAEVVTKVAAETSADATAFDALADDTVTAVKNVNDKIATVEDLSSEEAKNTFSTTQVLADQVKTAAEAEVVSAGSGSIDFTDTNKVNAAAANKAPTDITLSKSAIAEDASSLVIGTLITTDSDQTSGVLHTYKIAELAGTDYDAFSINATTGELSFKAQPDFEKKSSYSITILSTDEGGKTYSKSFNISVTNVNEAPILTLPTGGSVTEDASISTITGSLSSSDPENDAPTYSIVGATATNGSYTVTGTYGTLTLDASTGAYTYAMNNSAQAVNELGANDSETESFSVQVTDGTNTPAFQNLSFDIYGANDAITLTAPSTSVVVNENSTDRFLTTFNFIETDLNDSVEITLDGPDADKFNISLSDNSINFKEHIDYETQPSYDLSLVADDGTTKTKIEFDVQVIDQFFTVIFFDEFSYTSAQIDNVYLIDYSATYRDGWQSYYFDTFDHFTMLSDEFVNSNDFDGFTAFTKIPDNVTGKREAENDMQNVMNLIDADVTGLNMLDDIDQTDSDENFDYVYDYISINGLEYAYLDDLDGIDTMPWLPQAEARGIYISYYDIIPDLDGDFSYYYGQMSGDYDATDADPFADFRIFDYQPNALVDVNSQKLYYVGSSDEDKIAWANANLAMENKHGDTVIAEFLSEIPDQYENDIKIIAVDILGEDQTDQFRLKEFSGDTDYIETDEGFQELFDIISALDVGDITFANHSWVGANRHDVINNLHDEGIVSFAALPNDDSYGERYWDQFLGSDVGQSSAITIDVAGSELEHSALSKSLMFADAYDRNEAVSNIDFGTSFATPKVLGKTVQSVLEMDVNARENLLADDKLDVSDIASILNLTLSTATYEAPDPTLVFTERAGDIYENPIAYDLAELNTQAGTLSMTIENSSWWDLVIDELANSASELRLSITGSNVSTESGNWPYDYSSLSWEKVSSFSIEQPVDEQSFLIIEDEMLKADNIHSLLGTSGEEFLQNNDYIGFFVTWDSYWVGEDFLVSEVLIA